MFIELLSSGRRKEINMDRLYAADNALTIITIAALAALLLLGVGIEIGWHLYKWVGPKRKDGDEGLPRLPLPPRVPSFDQEVTHRPSQPPEGDDQGRTSTVPPDNEVDVRDLPPIEQLEAAGYSCEQLDDEEEFNRVLAGSLNFAESDDDRCCLVCGTNDFPYSVRGTSDTKEDGLIGYFCENCGCGFVVKYAKGEVSHEAKTVFDFLRPALAPVIELPKVEGPHN